MRLLDRIGSGWPVATIGLLVLLWLGLSGLLIAARGNPEVFLTTMLRRISRADAYQRLNGGLIAFWCMHSLLVLIAILASVAAPERRVGRGNDRSNNSRGVRSCYTAVDGPRLAIVLWAEHNLLVRQYGRRCRVLGREARRGPLLPISRTDPACPI